MNISWGTRIFFLYTAFVALIVTLVVSASNMDFDLVSKDYYQQELGFQKRLEATSATNALSEPVAVTANASNVVIIFPRELSGEAFTADVRFYSPINDTYDREFSLQATDGKVFIERTKLGKTAYRLQIAWVAGGRNYYQEIPLNLN